MQKQNLIEALLIFSKSDYEIFMNSLFSAIRKDGIDTFAEKTGIAIQDIMNCDDPDFVLTVDIFLKSFPFVIEYLPHNTVTFFEERIQAKLKKISDDYCSNKIMMAEARVRLKKIADNMMEVKQYIAPVRNISDRYLLINKSIEDNN